MNLIITLQDKESICCKKVEFFDGFVIGYDDHDNELGKVNLSEIVSMEAVS